MFFIQEGIVQILATDNKTVIAFQSQGCYFGEIGVLLTQKRSCSVKAVTMCTFMTITKEELDSIFDNYPQQGKFLRAIGRQRLLTTKPEDLMGFEENIFEIDDGENILFENTSELNNEEKWGQQGQPQDGRYATDAISMNKSRDRSNSLPAIKINTSELSDADEFSGKGYDDTWESQNDDMKKSQFSHWSSNKYESKNQKINLTDDFQNVKHFIIIPFSKLFNVWTVILFLAYFYFIMMVPFQLALNYDITEDGDAWALATDVTVCMVFLIDIFIRLRIAYKVSKRGEWDIVTDIDEIQQYYVNNLLIYDVLAFIPFDYLLLPFVQMGMDYQLLRLLRIFKLFKFGRIYETITIIQKHSNIPKALITFSMFFILFIILSHFLATSYIFIGQREVDVQGRFDGQKMFTDVTGRSFITPVDEIRNKDFKYLPPTDQMSKIELYIQFIYLSSCTMGAVMYGDIIPFAMSEQLFDFIAMFTCRIFLAFLFAEAASYLASIHKSASEHTKKVQKIKQWSNLNHLPNSLRDRMVNFYEILWINFKGVRQQKIIKDLPESLRQDVRKNLFKNIIKNWDIILNNNENGVISSIIQKLELRIIPKNEYIIRFGEIAQDMYFIIKGGANVISSEGIHLAELKVGDNFGEMALLEKGNLRSATVQAATDVSVAIMTTKDFSRICDLYPIFKSKIMDVVNKRKRENQETMDDIEFQRDIIKEQLKSKGLNEYESKEKHSSNEEKKEQIYEDSQSSKSSLQISKSNNDDHQVQKPSRAKPSQSDYLGIPNEASNEIQRANLKSTRNRSLNKKSAFDPDATQNTIAEVNFDESKTDRQLLSKREEDKQDQNNERDSGEQRPKGQIKYKNKNLNSKRRSSSFISRKFSKVSLKTGGINEHLNGSAAPQSYIKEILSQFASSRTLMKWIILFVAVYNIFFIPTQFAYRVEFKGIQIFLEVLTITTYMFDIYFRIRNLKLLIGAGGNLSQSENQKERTMMDDKDQFKKRVRNIKIEIACSMIATIPFSMIFQLCQYHEPLALVNPLCLLRLAKILPLIKLFEYLKRNNAHVWRVIEVVVTYYIISHILACIWISMGQFVEDVRETWVRRIKVPQELGMRDNPTLDDVSAGSLYIHSLYFTVNTISHVAIGDITAVNNSERVFVAIMILFGTFIYSFLYGNIASIVSDLAPNQYIAYFEKYQYVVQRLGPLKEQTNLMNSINEYFDYIWGNEHGQNQEEFLSDLPQGIRSDILLCKYQEAIEGSLIFKDDTGAIDVSLTNSIVKLMQIRVYLTDEFIFKVGSQSQNMYIILEGRAALYGAISDHKPRKVTDLKEPTHGGIVGYMKAGSHFGSDYGPGVNDHQSKRLCHMVSRQPCMVGIISAENLNILYPSFPKWKQKILTLNEFILKKCEAAFSQHQKLIKQQLEQFAEPNGNGDYLKSLKMDDLIQLYIENHLTYSTEQTYQEILERILKQEKYTKFQVPSQSDIVIMQKMFFYGQEDKQFPIFDNQYQQALKEQSGQNVIMKIIAGGQGALDESMIAQEQRPKPLDVELIKKTAMDLWDKCFMRLNSRARTIFDFIQTLNLLYIAVGTPLLIGFSIEMGAACNFFESISLIISFIWIIGNFRTQLHIKGETSLNFQKILQNYKRNGLYLDIIGIIPFNIMLGQSISKDHIFIKSLLRIIRVFSSYQSLKLFGKAEVSFKNKNFNIIMQVLKAILYTFFLGHFMACAWYFTVDVMEDGYEEPTWKDYNSLNGETIKVQYLRSIYTVFNVVCSVGYGDMFPMTDTERVFFTIMITMGDLLFALAFGLIASITFQIALQDETKQFKSKMYDIEEFMQSFNLDHAQQQRVEQYYAFEHQHKFDQGLLVYDDLIDFLPYKLRKEVIYQSSKDILMNFFKVYISENFIKDIASVLESVIFLPGDYVIYRGDTAQEMFFIAEGSVIVLSPDKQSVISKLDRHSHFGEIGIFMKIKRHNFVQAERFCIINILKQKDFQRITLNYPQIQKQLKIKERNLLQDKEQFSSELYGSTSQIEIHGMNLLKSEELAQFNEEYDDKKDQLVHRLHRQDTGHQTLENVYRSTSDNNVIKEENSSELTTSQLSLKQDQNQSASNEDDYKPALQTRKLSQIQNKAAEHRAPPRSQARQSLNINIQNNFNIVVDRLPQQSAGEPAIINSTRHQNKPNAQQTQDEVAQPEGNRMSTLVPGKDDKDVINEMLTDLDMKEATSPVVQKTAAGAPPQIVEELASAASSKQSALRPPVPADNPAASAQGPQRKKRRDAEGDDDGSKDPLEEFFSSSSSGDSEIINSSSQQKNRKRQSSHFLQYANPSPSSPARRKSRRPSFLPIGRASSQVLDGLYRDAGQSNLKSVLSQNSARNEGNQQMKVALGRRQDKQANNILQEPRAQAQNYGDISYPNHRARSSSVIVTQINQIQRKVPYDNMQNSEKGRNAQKQGIMEADKESDEKSIEMRRHGGAKSNLNHRGSIRYVGSIFRASENGEQIINHTIRRTAQKQSLQPIVRGQLNGNTVGQNMKQRKGANRAGRRLSRITLGRNLTLSQTAGLKLQWTVSS